MPGKLAVSFSVIDIFTRDNSGQSGHGVFIGLQLSRLFQVKSGQSGQTVLTSPMQSCMIKILPRLIFFCGLTTSEKGKFKSNTVIRAVHV